MRPWLAAFVLVLLAFPARADELLGVPLSENPASLLAHPGDAPFWLSGQLNVISQAHPAFDARYSGPNSLRPGAEAATSLVATVYGVVRLGPTTQLVLHGESAAGGGIGDALGVAGFTNLDVVRNPTLGSAPYVARAMLVQVVPLSDDEIEVESGPFHLGTRQPARRLTFRAGKLGTADLFDTNRYGSDSHLQFMNWAVDNDAAYDYAADTRGYTLGAVAEYAQPSLAVRLGVLLMPKVANGIDYDWDLGRARGQNLELELHRAIWSAGETVVRLLAYWNLARMGSYREANDAAIRGAEAVPDITRHRAPGRSTFGGGINFEQPLRPGLALFGRAGLNDGANESFAYTEANDSAELGLHLDGQRWARADDSAGLAVVTSGLSPAHREYLRRGGQGFLLGDGGLRYGRESLFEAYYTLSLGHGLSTAADLQAIANPGYNRDRGPVLVGAVRVHLEI